MKEKIEKISKKITLLNQTIFDCMMEKNNKAIIKTFTETGIEILEADFGFTWWKFSDSEEYELAYKSPSTPYTPTLPRAKAGNYIALKTKKPFFDGNVKAENYEFDIKRYLSSYIIIPVLHSGNVYGNLVVCYKKQHKFSKNELALAKIIGNTIAQALTVHKLFGVNTLLDQEKSKTEFIANATHELRTPLAIMRGNVDLALESKNSPSTDRDLKAIRTEISQLSEILSNLAILTSKTGHHKNIIHMEEVDVLLLMNQIIKRVQVLLDKKKIKLKITTDKNKLTKLKKIFITGDKQYLEKLFINLIRNAIIYGHEGGKIIIDIRGDKKKITVKVEDNGIGISKKDLPHIFERFYRSEEAWRQTTIGTGLGLAISKWVVDVHHGNISASSKMGKGSIFKVILPISPTKSNK